MNTISACRRYRPYRYQLFPCRGSVARSTLNGSVLRKAYGGWVRTIRLCASDTRSFWRLPFITTAGRCWFFRHAVGYGPIYLLFAADCGWEPCWAWPPVPTCWIRSFQTVVTKFDDAWRRRSENGSEYPSDERPDGGILDVGRAQSADSYLWAGRKKEGFYSLCGGASWAVARGQIVEPCGLSASADKFHGTSKSSPWGLQKS